MSRLCAIVVTYFPEATIIAHLAAALSQVDYLYVVDNGSDVQSLVALREFCAAHPNNTQLIENNENLGLATAQNQAIRLALAEDFSWLLLLDDDSIPAPDMVAQMLAAYAQTSGNIGIVAPRILDKNNPQPTRYIVPQLGIGFDRISVAPDMLLHDALIVIASGSLIRADLFRHIGVMCEGLFIDYIDYDFCLRARAAGYSILVVGQAVLMHELGQKKAHTALGARIITSNHSTLRRYYIFRNRLWIMRRFGARFPAILLHEAIAFVWDMLRITLLESEKTTKLQSAMRGVWHGLSRPLPPTTRL